MLGFRDSTKNSVVCSTLDYILDFLTRATAVSEGYRLELRSREDGIRVMTNRQTSADNEIERVRREVEVAEQRIADLQAEMEALHLASAQLEHQKQENLLLKETIDRMRFEMDELRNNPPDIPGGPPSIPNSRSNTVSKSLGAELGKRLREKWGSDEDTEEVEEGDSVDTLSADDEGDGEEDVIQTIITRKRVCLVAFLYVSCSFHTESCKSGQQG